MMNQRSWWLACLGCGLLAASAWADEATHAERDHAHASAEADLVRLTQTQIQQMGIVSQRAAIEKRHQAVRAPGTVHVNGYRVAEVAPQLDGVVHRRFVRLGQRVRAGDPLLTITSTALATAEAEYLKSEAAWRQARAEHERLKQLAAQRIVSQARLQQAERAARTARARWQAARAVLLAYGLDDKAIAQLPQRKRYGLLTLRAPMAGTVVADHFVQGQYITAGTMLVRIADERTVWVEAKLPAARIGELRTGLPARVFLPGSNKAYPGKLSHIFHRLDPATRMATVRLTVENPDDLLHEGMFVQAEIALARAQRGIWLPEQAVQRQGEEWIVFVEQAPGRYERREIEIDPPQMGWVRVRRGLQPEERVVVQGAFALLAELEKGGFAAHQH